MRLRDILNKETLKKGLVREILPLLALTATVGLYKGETIQKIGQYKGVGTTGENTIIKIDDKCYGISNPINPDTLTLNKNYNFTIKDRYFPFPDEVVEVKSLDTTTAQ